MYLLSKRLKYASEHNTNKNTNCGPISENPNMVCIIFFLSIYFLPQFYSFFQKSENKTGEWYVLYFFPQSLFSLIEYFRPKIYLLPQFYNRIKNPRKFKTTKNKKSLLGLVSFDVFPRDSHRWHGRLISCS